MKKIKIFLASSINDLREDRLQVGDFIRQLNEIYLDNGVHFSLVKCEDYDNAMSASGKQSEYDREIRESELVFFLFFKKVGDYTKHEFEIAMEAFKESSSPKIVTYFKYVDTIEEVNAEVKAFMALLDGEFKHYYNTYNHIDALKLGILMQIKLMKLDASEVKIQDGAVLLNGQKVVAVENVPILRGNDTLMELTRKKKELTEKLNACRAAYLADPTPEKESAFFNASAELNAVSKQLTEIEKSTMEFMSTVAEITSDGKVLTYRQKEALKYYDQGDYDAAQAILSDEERENELERAENKAESAKNEIQGYVNEDLLWIETEKTRGITAEGAVKIKEKYEKVISLTEKYDLDKKVLYDYASFLEDQNDYSKAIEIAERLRWYYSAPNISVDDGDVAKLYNLLGELYIIVHKTAEAESALQNSLEIRKRIAKQNPEAYNVNLWRSYNALACLYYSVDRFADAETMLAQAIVAIAQLAAITSEEYETELAEVYNNLGATYCKRKDMVSAKKYLDLALEIRKKLVAKAPLIHTHDLSIYYANIGYLYYKAQNFSEAEEAYKSAIELQTQLCKRNPAAYEPNLATSYHNLGLLYRETQRFEEAEAVFNIALEARKRLSRSQPDAYVPELGCTLTAIGFLYYLWKKNERSRHCFNEAIKTYEMLDMNLYGSYREEVEAIKKLLEYVTSDN